MAESIQDRLRGWINRWRDMRLSPPPGLADDMREAADLFDAIEADAFERAKAATNGPQAAASPPWGWTDKGDGI